MKEIKLTRGEVALVDDSDFNFLNQWKWHVRQGHNTRYAVRVVTKRHTVSMHRVIMQVYRKDLLIDHIDLNGLNNQKNNLRICDKFQNAKNRRPRKNGSSKYLGVSWCKTSKKWIAQININKKIVHLGRFSSEEEAAKAYDHRARLNHKEFANLNFK